MQKSEDNLSDLVISGTEFRFSGGKFNFLIFYVFSWGHEDLVYRSKAETSLWCCWFGQSAWSYTFNSHPF